MNSTFGRIDPVADRQRTDSAEPPLSPALISDLHADLVRQKRLALLKAIPLLLIAAALALAAAMDPLHLAGLALWAGLAFVGVGGVGIQWLQLRRADPMRAYELDQQAEATRLTDLVEHNARAASVRPVATIALTTLIVIVTLVQFVSGSLGHGIAAAALVKPAVRAGQWWRLLTASYMHGSVMHLVSNAGGLLLLGHFIETYDRRMRVPLVYLAAAIGGNIASTLAISAAALGASGGVLGLAGYLLVVAGRVPGGAPAWIRQRMWRIIGPTAVIGIVAFFFIDNAAHAGGLATGAAIGAFTVRWAAHSDRRARQLDALGWAASLVLLAGAIFTVTRLVG